MMFVWICIGIVSTGLLVKSSDWLLESGERMGLAFGMSPFVIGMLVVGLGTSFPELITSFAAIIEGTTSLVVANTVGSNITNIFLVVGVSAVVGRGLLVTKNLIDIDLPLLAITTGLMLIVVHDGQVVFLESAVLVIGYSIYFAYIILHKEGSITDYETVGDILPSRDLDKSFFALICKGAWSSWGRVSLTDCALFFFGAIGLVVGAKYLIDSVIILSELLNLVPSVIAISAVALGTSLPELLVSVRAALKKRSEVALGNIFGSNVFNALIVVGVPGLFSRLEVDQETLTIGLPFLLLATVLFIISGISKRIHIWEGLLYILVYVLFLFTLFGVV